jgi:4-diphosphocytidyl-2C-methyl-D-erythritol kinase
MANCLLPITIGIAGGCKEAALLLRALAQFQFLLERGFLFYKEYLAKAG